MIKFSDSLMWGSAHWDYYPPYISYFRSVHTIHKNKTIPVFQVLRIILPQDYRTSDTAVHFTYTYFIFPETQIKCIAIAKSIEEAEHVMISHYIKLH